MSSEIKDVKNKISKSHNSVLFLNIYSINKNLHHLENLCRDISNPKILAISEVWQPYNIRLNGYQNPEFKLRTNKRGGGLGIFVRSGTSYKVYHEISNHKFMNIEVMAIEIKEKFNNFIVICVYRPPNSNLILSLNEIKVLFELASKSKKNHIIGGDLNIDISKHNHITNEYLDLIQYFQLSQIINTPTRITSKSSSIIDHIICSQNIKAECAVISATVSDHLPTIGYWKPKNSFHKKNTSKKSCQTYEKIDLKNLTDKLLNSSQKTFNNLNSNKSFNELHSDLSKKIKESTLTKKLVLKPRNPWYSIKSMLLKKDLDKKRRLFLKNNNLENESAYKECKKQYNKQIRLDKNTYYNQKLKDAQGNQKKIWQIINEVLSRKQRQSLNSITMQKDGKEFKTDEEISNCFNTFFNNIAIDIAKSIEKSKYSVDHYLQKSKKSIEKFELKEVTCNEVYKIIMSLSNKKSKGPDNISNYLLKKVSPYIIKDITTCVNKSFKENCFPSLIKTAKINPIFKKGEPEDPNNWRPISQLSPFSKVYEKLYLKQLENHYHSNQLLIDEQFGFRANHSTIHPLLIIKDFIEKELNKNKQVLLISIDLKKAFDIIQTNGLLQKKISHLIGNEGSLKWISSFFDNRQQFTNWNQISSNTVKCNEFSIVQGSSQGPTMFISFLNDIKHCSRFKIVLFADDTSLLLSNANPTELENTANSELEKVKDYFSSNKLAINVEKTCFLHFLPKKTTVKSNLSLKLGNQNISEKKELEFLGVIIDNTLSFKSHYQKVLEKVKKGLNGLIISKNLLNYQAKMSIYYGLLHSHLTYCSLIWVPNLTKKEKKALSVIQKKAVRIIHSKKYNSHTSKLFEENGITKFENIIEMEGILMTYKYLNKELPKAIMHLFESNIETNRIATRESDKLLLKTKSNTEKRNIMYQIIKSWNSIDYNIKIQKSIPIIKRKLKKEWNKGENCTKSHCYNCNI